MNQFEQIQKKYQMQQERIKNAQKDRDIQQQRRAQIARSLQEEIESGVKVLDDTVAHASLKETFDEAARKKIEEKRNAAIDAANREKEQPSSEKKSLFSFGKKKPSLKAKAKKEKKPLFGKKKDPAEHILDAEEEVSCGSMDDLDLFGDDFLSDTVTLDPDEDSDLPAKKPKKKSYFGKR